jgi:hypothetical protein
MSFESKSVAIAIALAALATLLPSTHAGQLPTADAAAIATMNSLAGTLRTAYLPPDGMAHIAAAGRSTADGQRAGDCLQWGGSERPTTPEGVKKCRSPLAHEPGQITRHHGTAADPLPAGPFGSKSKASSESAAQCMRTAPETEIARWKLERAEQVYARWGGRSLGACRGLVRPRWPAGAEGSREQLQQHAPGKRRARAARLRREPRRTCAAAPSRSRWAGP